VLYLGRLIRDLLVHFRSCSRTLPTLPIRDLLLGQSRCKVVGVAWDFDFTTRVFEAVVANSTCSVAVMAGAKSAECQCALR